SELESINCKAYKIVFIFDGLDECRLPLNYKNNKILCDVTEAASVDVLFTNLIKGNLLPSAHLWITSRPVAAHQLPSEHVDLVTDVRGFSDPQKEEYFRKRISDQNLANKIITHIKSSRSLSVMCQIPVFCWISATVLERMLSEAESQEIPKTLTQMFTHFLIFQIESKDQKQTRETILALGELAFQQLEKGNLIFYEEDLRECGIVVREASKYSEVCTQIFGEEFELHLGKVFSFIHLSVQEYLAALYAFLSFFNRNLIEQHTTYLFKNSNMSDFLKSAVDKALMSKTGHLDLFLRFLLGLSLESNQTLLRSLLPQTTSSSRGKDLTVRYIKEKIQENLSVEKSINLFHCLDELNDQHIVQEVQNSLRSGDYNRLRERQFTSIQWSALVFVLLNSTQEHDEFDLRTYHQTEECLIELLAVVKESRKAVQKLRQALGGQVVLPDDWETTAEVIRETGRKVLGVSSGRRKEDKETWWWNEEVQDSIQRKRLAKKKWDMDRTEENRQEYKELQRRVKREVSKAKQKAYDELYTRLDTREGEKDLYRLARQRDRDGKDVQQVRVIKDRDGRVLTSEESVQRRWKEYFEELMNEENEREKRVEGVNSVEQKVDKIRKDEVRKALKRMKSGKAVGPDDIPVEVWKCLGEAAVEFLASLFNRVLESERMPEEWRRSVLVPIFKNKGDVQSCSNYRGIKLMSHTMKLWERVVEARLRKVVEICEQQYGFMPRKSTTDAIFALRILMEKYRDGQRELHCVFVDLEKVYDRVPREELWYCMRKSGVAEKYVRVLQDMYERSRTVVRCAVGQTEEFKVEVGLHQGSALSPFLFAIVMDQLSEEVRQESPWTMMFADDIVICSESREQVEENLERWRFALERRGMKVSRSKTEYMCVNEREGSGTVRLQGEEVKKVQEFKYLGSTVQSNGECGKEVKKRVQAGWNGWRKVSGVLCDQKISARIKGKVYRTVVRAAMLYGLETVSLRKRQESELEVAELKMLRFSLGVTSLDRIRNEYIRGTAHVGRLGDKVREARLRWFGHVQRRESEYIGRRMLDMELPGRRQRGRPKRRLYGCNLSEVSCRALTRVISSNTSRLRQLDLSENKLYDAGAKLLSEGLQSKECKLEILWLVHCGISDDGCVYLASAVKSNPESNLCELNLNRNEPGDQGVMMLSDLLKDTNCKLKIL
ncbi:hypothetical protein QTP86_020814, partial [Hemibagrus guttatus]